MRAFLFPHQLLAPPVMYRAALHADDMVAQTAFAAWAHGLNVEQIRFAQHKLIGLMARRFAPSLDQLPQAGVLHNIARQGRLRAHAQLAILRRLLAHGEIAALGLMALGGLRERLQADAAQAGDLEGLELCIMRSRWSDALASFAAAGWQPKSAPRHALGRRAMIGQLVNPAENAAIRLLALGDAAPQAVPLKSHAGLCVMDDRAHRAFVASRRHSLLLRRDQAVFDLALARNLSNPQATLTMADLPWWFRGKAHAVLGS